MADLRRKRAWLYRDYRRRTGLFTPADLFGVSDVGCWYDPSDLSSMWQESSQTTGAVVDSPVGHINDKSGNGNHASQATDAKRSILRQSGALFYLEFEGVDDFLKSIAFACAQPFDRVSALTQVSYTQNDRVFDAEDSTNKVLFHKSSTELRQFYGSNGPTTADFTAGSAFVVTEHLDGASSTLQANNNTAATGNSGTGAGNGLTIAASQSGSLNSDLLLYGVTQIDRALTDAEIANTKAYYAVKAGVTL